MQITEPVTMLTDYALAAASLLFAVLLGRMIGPRNRVSAWLWCAGFLASAVAALLGGTYHGFALELDAGTHRSLWNGAMALIGVSFGLMIGGVHSANVQREDGTVRWMVLGIVTTAAGGSIQLTGFRHASAFNHNDAFHIIQIIAFYFLFRGASTLRDRYVVPTR